MSKKYPRICEVQKRKKNTQAQCVCGNLAQYKTHVQYNYMRGDDDVIWSCDDHKKDALFLIAEPAKGHIL